MLLCMLICVCAEKAKAATAKKKYTERARSNEEEESFKARIYKKATYTSSVVEFKANSDYLQIQPVQYEAHTTVERKVVYVVHKFYASANYPLEYRSNFSYIPSSSSSIHPSK